EGQAAGQRAHQVHRAAAARPRAQARLRETTAEVEGRGRVVDGAAGVGPGTGAAAQVEGAATADADVAAAAEGALHGQVAAARGLEVAGARERAAGAEVDREVAAGHVGLNGALVVQGEGDVGLTDRAGRPMQCQIRPDGQRDRVAREEAEAHD